MSRTIGADSVIAYVTEHPGCTSAEVRHALDRSAACFLSKLVVQGRLRREPAGPAPLEWRYFPVSP